MLIDQLIARLQRERFETDAPGHSPDEVAWRRGWNRRTDDLIAMLELERERELAEATPCR